MKPQRIPLNALRAGAASALGLSMVLTPGLPASSALTDEDLFRSATASIGEAVLAPSMQKAEGQISVFVQFKGAGAYESTQPAAVLAGTQAPVDAQSQVQAIASAVEQQGQAVAAETGSEVLYTAHNSLRGVALRGDAGKIRELASRGDVIKISPIVAKYPSNTGTTIDTKALETWQQTGYTGKDVKIAVIDSGVDYTHSQFGGPGTVADYKKAKAMTEMPAADSGLYDPEKFIGGYDLAGDDYDARDTASVPQPDNNPLDCEAGGHGTHVAGTAAGYAVEQDGSTFKGDYTKISADQMREMKIGAGSAPEAQIMAFRVFGCDGSTNLTGEALDRSLDPNQDGKFDDRADIINMSLGSDFGAIDDPENLIVDALTRQGILSVVAAGNSTAADGNGDTYSVSGNPANAVSSLAVANTIGSTGYTDVAKILEPSSIAGEVTGGYSASFDYTSASKEQLVGDVVMAPENNRFACDAFPAGTDFGGKWVFIEWSEDPDSFPCGSKVRFDNIQKAGGAGVVLASMHEHEEIGIAGNASIPGVRLSKSAADKAREAAKAGTLRIELSADNIAAATFETGKFDQPNDSTARGAHGSNGFTKPDVAAPGTSIGSAGVATGNGKAVMTGTSMATPHTAGVAALVLQANQQYSASQVKAAIMNSAVHEVTTADGVEHSVERVGSGRIDALRAVNQKVLFYNADTPEQVSESFGVVEVAADAGVQTFTRKITVDNSDSQQHTYQVSFDASSDIPGVSISAPQSVTVPAGGTVNFTVTATVDPSQLEKTLEPASTATQLDVARQYLSAESGRLVLTENGEQNRLPVQIAPKPVASMKAASASLEFGNDATEATINLEGTSVNQGGYKSLVGAYELGATSDRLQTSTLATITEQRVDLQYVGAASNVPALKKKGGDPAKQGLMSIGISTWANWENLTEPTSIEVAIDVDNNNRPDFFLFTSRVAGLDYPLANLAGYVNGELEVISQMPVNGAFGDVDTNTFDSNTLNLPVSLEAMGITEANAANLRYAVNTISWYDADGQVDGTDWISYNPYAPALDFTGTASDSVSLFEDSADTDITVTRAEAGATDAKALLLHMHNGTGDLSGVKKGEDGAKAEVLNMVNSGVSEDVTNPRFTDVPENYQFYKEIAWLAERGITTGYSDGTYRPHGTVERGAMAAFFYRMAGSPQFTAPSVSPFSDVPTTHQFYKEIAWMESTGITTGYSDGTFRPRAAVNRDAMAAFFYRFAGEPAYTAPATSKFTDMTPQTQFYKEVSWLADQGITTGWQDGTFRPTTSINRDAMAAFIYRYDQNVASKK